MQTNLEFSDSPVTAAVTRLVARTWVAALPEAVFEFFSEPQNLARLTPASMKFRIVTPEPLSLGNGTRIAYRLRVHGIPLRWESEIRDWNPPHEFVDVQLHGPYRSWHHRHRFSAEDGGTLVIDEVDYAPPGGWLFDRLFIRRDLRKIFSYRIERLSELFPTASHS
jgi:ligand-binding SRPBCC domain-containing protein